jgi:hypothetical protein
LITVSDTRSNAPEQIAHAAKTIGRSPHKAAVFRAVYHGKKKQKTIDEVVKDEGVRAEGMSRKRVLEEAAKLAGHDLFGKKREKGTVMYEPYSFLAANKHKIFSLARNRAKLEAFPTKRNPKGNAGTVTIKLPRQRVRVKHVTIDDIDSFSAVRKKKVKETKLAGMSEKEFKEGVKRIIGEKGEFLDWGGEKNDLLSTRLVYKGKRRRAAFAFKGPGKAGTLTPGKMGKNGDQIQRLFDTVADFYFLQYWNQIAESVPEQIDWLAKAHSVAHDREIFYGIIDGADSARLVNAYPKNFPPATKKRGKRANKANH